MRRVLYHRAAALFIFHRRSFFIFKLEKKNKDCEKVPFRESIFHALQFFFHSFILSKLIDNGLLTNAQNNLRAKQLRTINFGQ